VPGAEDARRHLAAIAASPRPAGSAEEAAARRYCERLLREHGFSVREEPFEYSAVPGRYATPLAGAFSVLALAAAAYVGSRGGPTAGWSALAVLCTAAIPLVLGASWAARQGVLAIRAVRARAVNLTAARGDPRVWLIAHLDSKSQPVPIGVRALGITLSVVAWLGAVSVAALQLVRAEAAGAWPWVTGVGVLAGIPVIASVVGAESPGALDNASGVAVVLLLAAALPPDAEVGVVLTSAEELGLAGARAWVRGRAPARVINFDGVDDEGAVRLAWTRRRPRPLLSALLAGARSAGVTARAGRLLPGILVDGVAFADAGWEVVTVSKGTARTVGRIHTRRDVAAALDGRGIAQVASLVGAALREIRSWS
jgi:hypothetical protein